MKKRIAEGLARLFSRFSEAAVFSALLGMCGAFLTFVEIERDLAGQELAEKAGCAWIGLAAAVAIAILFGVLRARGARITGWPWGLCALASAGFAIWCDAGSRSAAGSAAALFTIALFLLSLYVCVRGQEPGAMRRILGWLFSAIGLCAVLCIALMLIVGAVCVLIVPEGHVLTAMLMVFALSACWIGPWLFLGGVHLPFGEDREAKPFRPEWKVVLTVWLVLYLALLAVLDVYVVIILVTWKMPVGVMNGFALTALFLFLLFRLTLTGEESAFSAQFLKWGAYPLIPVIIAQQVGVWIRLSAYGLTESRIFGLAASAVGIAAVIGACFRKTPRFALPLAAVLLLALALPWTSPAALAVRDQEARLLHTLVRCGMVDREPGADGQGWVIRRLADGAETDEADRAAVLSGFDFFRWRTDLAEGSFAAAFKEQARGKSAKELFGFPDTGGSAWVAVRSSRTSSTYVEVAGFAAAEYFTAELNEEDTEVILDGKAITREEVESLADWEAETLKTEEIPLNGGAVARLTSVTLRRTADGETAYWLRGWILRP